MSKTKETTAPSSRVTPTWSSRGITERTTFRRQEALPKTKPTHKIVGSLRHARRLIPGWVGRRGCHPAIRERRPRRCIVRCLFGDCLSNSREENARSGVTGSTCGAVVGQVSRVASRAKRVGIRIRVGRHDPLSRREGHARAYPSVDSHACGWNHSQPHGRRHEEDASTGSELRAAGRVAPRSNRPANIPKASGSIRTRRAGGKGIGSSDGPAKKKHGLERQPELVSGEPRGNSGSVQPKRKRNIRGNTRGKSNPLRRTKATPREKTSPRRRVRRCRNRIVRSACVSALGT